MMEKILGKSIATLAQMKNYLRKKNPDAPDLAAIYLKEGAIEGVRGDISFAQMIKETGNLYFTKDGTENGEPGTAKIEWKNPAGLGVVGTPNVGERFSSWQIGIQAQIQHLFAYAKPTGLPYQKLVDNRFGLVPRGSAIYWENLNGKWSVPGFTYGQDIVKIYNDILKESLAELVRIPFTQMSVARLIEYCETFKWTRQIKYIDIHHTYSPNLTNYRATSEPLYWQEAMRRYHVVYRGFRDIAQHVTLYPDNCFVTGRDFNWDPASNTGNNANVFMIETLGNFDVGYDKFESEQADTMFSFLAQFLTLKNLSMDAIRFHRDLPNTGKTCPGTSIIKSEFINAVDAYRKYKLY